jgi:hypothetical protein
MSHTLRPTVRRLTSADFRDPGSALADWGTRGDLLHLTFYHNSTWKRSRHYRAVMGGRAVWSLGGIEYQQQRITVLPGLSLVSVIAQRVQV